MFTNTKCKNLLEYHRFKYRLYFLSQSRVVSQTQSETVTIHILQILHVREFPDDVLTRDGNFVNDIVIDPDGGYAYMSDVGTGPDLRPGGIVGRSVIPVFLNWTTLTKEPITRNCRHFGCPIICTDIYYRPQTKYGAR